MAQATGMIELLDPTAEDVPKELGLSENLPALKGKVVGLLENRKYHADAFLGELKDILLNEYGAAKVVYSTKFTYSAPCADETLQSLADDCDVVIHAIAD